MKRNIYGSHTRNIWFKFLAALLIIVTLSIVAAYGALKKGIHIKNFSFSNFSITAFHLTLDEKLELEVGHIQVKSTVESFSFEKDFPKIRQGIQSAVWAVRLFSQLEIHSIALVGAKDTFKISLSTLQQPWLLNVSSADLQFTAEIYPEENQINAHLNSITSAKFQSTGSSQMRVDLKNEQITGTFDANIAGRLPLSLDFTADKKEITFHSKDATEADSIVEIVDLFGLDADIQIWITDYLKGASYTLRSIKGTIPWEDPHFLKDSLYGEVRITEAEYIFAQGLPPIRANYADVVYNKGILKVTPHEATFAGQSTGESWLDINFTDPDNILLTTYLRTHTDLNEDILTLLRYYEIDLPFKQVEGDTAVDLNLVINLNSEEVNASGTFLTAQSSFFWSGQELQIKDAKIGITDSDIAIERLAVALDDIAAADLTGRFNASSNSGEIYIVLSSFKLEIGNQLLTTSGKKPKATLLIKPEQYILEARPSFWKFGDLELQLDNFTAPISPDEFRVTLPPTSLTSHPQLVATISGSYSTLLNKARFSAELAEFDFLGLSLNSEGLPLNILLEDGWKIRADETSQWLFNDTALSLGATHLQYNQDRFSFHTDRVLYGGIFQSGISGIFDPVTQNGNFSLGNLLLSGENLGDLPGDINRSNKGFAVDIPEIALHVAIDDNKEFSARIDDLSPLHKRSALLQQLKVNTGKLVVNSEHTTNSYTFNAAIEEPLPILLKNGVPITQWALSGTIANDSLSLNLNEDLQINYSEIWSISSEEIDYNIPELIQLIKHFAQSPNKQKADDRKLKMVLKARNTSLFLRQGSEVLADAFTFSYADNTSTLHLEHGEGAIDASSEGDRLQVVGKNLNSIFMDALAREAEFSEGEMSFVAYGRFNRFSVILQVNDVLLKRFTTLNKILAFINTVPDLATFSLPEYGAQGLPVTTAIAGAVVEDGVATIKSFDLQSPQMTMLGNGWVNIPGNLMEMEFNLITKAKSKLSKIPLFGYIIVGQKEVPSITVKVTGDVSDPQVESSMFKEITTIPFSMLYRTLTLPYTVVEPVYDSMKKYETPEKSFPYGEKKDEDGK